MGAHAIKIKGVRLPEKGNASESAIPVKTLSVEL